MNQRNIIILCLFFLLTSCGFKADNSESLSIALNKTAECRNMESLFWHSFHNASLNEQNPTSWNELKTVLLENGADLAIKKLVDALSTTLTDEFWKKNQQDQLQIWAELQLKVTDQPGWADLQSQMDLIFKQQSVEALTVCDDGTDIGESPSPILSVGSAGGRKAMAVAYQSCQAPVIKPITAATTDIVGIKVKGTLSNGGKNRVIASLPDVQKTHPYLNMQNTESTCVNVSLKPLIYDFGGKPYYASASTTEMDLMKNAGSGGSVLGIDCSGLVFTAWGMEGLQLIPNQKLTASLIKGVSSRTLLNPPSAWKCVERIKVGLNENLKPGDVLSVDGHTVLIDEVGQDPWGASHFTDSLQCTKIIEDDLNFVILQSSPSKNGVGINRYQIQDYLKENATMKKAFLKYAKNHCENFHTQKSVRPKWSDVSVIRHTRAPDCVGRTLTLKYESCVSQCAL